MRPSIHDTGCPNCGRQLHPIVGGAYQCGTVDCDFGAGTLHDLLAYRLGGYEKLPDASAEVITALRANRRILRAVRIGHTRARYPDTEEFRQAMTHAPQILPRWAQSIWFAILTREELEALIPEFEVLNPDFDGELPPKGETFACIPWYAGPTRVVGLRVCGVGEWDADPAAAGIGGRLNYFSDDRETFLCPDLDIATKLFLDDERHRLVLVKPGMAPVLPDVRRTLPVASAAGVATLSRLVPLFPEAKVAVIEGDGRLHRGRWLYSEILALACVKLRHEPAKLEALLNDAYITKDLAMRLRTGPVGFDESVYARIAARAEEGVSPVRTTADGYLVHGKRVTDFTLRPLRWKQRPGGDKSLECLLTLAGENQTVSYEAAALWSAAAFNRSTNRLCVGQRTPAVLLPKQMDHVRELLIAQTEGLPTVPVCDWPGLYDGVYHLPGFAVASGADAVSGLESDRWTVVPDRPMVFTHESLHLLLLVAAMLTRDAGQQPMGCVQLKATTDNANALIDARRVLGQKEPLDLPARCRPFVRVAPRGAEAKAGVIALADDGLLLSAPAEIREVNPRRFFAFCISRALGGNAKYLGAPTADKLSAEGTKLLEAHQPNMMPLRLDLLGNPHLCRLLKLIGKDTVHAFRFDLTRQAYAFQPQEYDLEPGPIYTELYRRCREGVFTNGHTLYLTEANLKRILLLYHKDNMPLGVGPRDRQS